jgi:hypothetical protein
MAVFTWRVWQKVDAFRLLKTNDLKHCICKILFGFMHKVRNRLINIGELIQAARGTSYRGQIAEQCSYDIRRLTVANEIAESLSTRRYAARQISRAAV